MDEEKRLPNRSVTRKGTSSESTKRKAVSSKNKNTIKNGGKKGSKKNKKKGNRKEKIIKRLFIFIFFITILIGIIFFLLNFDAFKLKEVKINGTERYDVNNLMQELNIKYEENIFKQIYYISKSDYSNLSYIERLKPKFVSNNTILLDIEERVPLYIAFDKEANKYYRLDANGYILEECKPSFKTENEIILTGIAFDNEVNIGSKISDVYLKKIDSYLEIKEEYEDTELKNYGNITKVDFNNSLTTIIINDKLNVILENGKNLKYNMSLLQGIIQKLPESSVGTIDMTKENPIYSAY